MVTLILEERLAYLFLIMNASSVRVELRVVRRVSVRLKVLGVPGGPSIYRRCLACGPMRVHLLFIQHFHLLRLILVAARSGRILANHAIMVVSALLIEAVRILHAG